MRLTGVVFVALLPFSIAKPLLAKRWNDFEVKHAWEELPNGWTSRGPAPANHIVDMRISLKQGRFDELLTALHEVSDPAHERYGKHLSKEEVDALVAPHPTSVNLVEDWLAAHGIDVSSVERDNGGSSLRVPVTVDVASRMLNTTYQIYQHDSTSEVIVRTASYSLPSSLHPHIDVVTPTTYFSTMRSMRKMSFEGPHVTPLRNEQIGATAKLINRGSLATVPSSCATGTTPSCLQALYNTSTYVPQAPGANILGIAGYSGDLPSNADLQTFLQKFRTDAAGAAFKLIPVNGGDDQSDPDLKANAVIQYAEGLTFPTPVIYYSTGGSPPFNPDSQTPTDTNEPYLDWLNFILNSSPLPQTFTTSYGDDEQTVPIDYATNVCKLFAQLGARGSSVLFGSGDVGVGGGDCLTNNGKKTKRFQPKFPASCPFVTTVGGTSGTNPEAGTSFSGGGFSNYFARPSYQAAPVAAFLNRLGVTNSGLFNASGRAYPDVSAQARSYQVVLAGVTGSVAGTSLSTPTFASVIALLNDFRISRGKSPLGFLNPLLYSTGISGLNDITSGNNPGCNTQGFTAGPGWDPVTGLGTPDFGKLQSLIG